MFDALRWLGLGWDSGPRDPDDFIAHHSQRRRLPAYRAALERLARGSVYACTCSRQEAREAALAAGTPGVYPGTCRALGRDLATPGAAWRLALDPAEEIVIRDLAAGEIRVSPARGSGDVVVRQRNGEPSYHLASVVDDQDLGVDLVVRGRDLLPSTAVQLALARRLGAEGFLAADFLHHGLIVAAGSTEPADAAGALAKLSKSAGGRPGGARGSVEASLRVLRERLGTPARVYGFFARLLGLDPGGRTRAEDLLEGFASERIPTRPIRWEDFVEFLTAR